MPKRNDPEDGNPLDVWVNRIVMSVFAIVGIVVTIAAWGQGN